jgi:phosphocarrier protein
MAERQVKVEPGCGLHARPATLFVQTAAKAGCDVTVAKSGAAPVNAKSMLAILGLDARCGEVITIAADGEGAERLVDDLAALVTEG